MEEEERIIRLRGLSEPNQPSAGPNRPGPSLFTSWTSIDAAFLFFFYCEYNILVIYNVTQSVPTLLTTVTETNTSFNIAQ